MVMGNNNQVRIDWPTITSYMVVFMFVMVMMKMFRLAISDEPELLPQAIGGKMKLRFATTRLDVTREEFAEWVRSEKIQLLQAGGWYRRGRRPTLAVLDNEIYAVVPYAYGDKISLLRADYRDVAEETLPEAEERGLLLPEVKLLPR